MDTFYWFDFETYGTLPEKDRPCQFAGIRTDHQFNLIGEPLNIFCQPANDVLPHPEACLITGITPQHALNHGVCESDFFAKIHQELAQPNTCSVGYNNIRFDDEVIRYGFYRNFFDIYGREFQNANSRWDILDMLRMTYALRPEGIQWPLNDEGNPSFHLELLTKANNILHDAAHDALSDVYATIAMAKLVKQKQPKLYDYLFKMRNKRQVAALLHLQQHPLFVHSSGMLGSEHHFTGVMMPLLQNPANNNSIICLNLLHDFDALESLTVEEIKYRLFTKQADLTEGVQRLSIKEIHINKCPAVAPLGVLDNQSLQRLAIDLSLCQSRAKKIFTFMDELNSKLKQVFAERNYKPILNPDYALYSGFFSPSDSKQVQKVRQLDWETLSQTKFNFKDNRLDDLLFRFRARNAPWSLKPEEKLQWDSYCYQQLINEASDASINYPQLKDKIALLLNQELSDHDRQILISVEEYATKLIADLSQNQR